MRAVPIDARPFGRLAIDHVGPLKQNTKRFKYLLTVTCTFTKFVIAIPVTNLTAEKVVENLRDSVFLRYTYPKEILSDNGTAFTSRLVDDVCRFLGIRHVTISTYWPQSNGIVERWHRSMKVSLVICGHLYSKTWDKIVHYICYAYNVSKHTSTQFSPMELLWGIEPHGPLELHLNHEMVESDNNRANDMHHYVQKQHEYLKTARKLASEYIIKYQNSYLQRENRNRKDFDFAEGNLVLLRKYGPESSSEVKYEGPFIIMKITGKSNAILMQRGKPEAAQFFTHMSKLKRYYPKGDTDDEQLIDTSEYVIPEDLKDKTDVETNSAYNYSTEILHGDSELKG